MSGEWIYILHQGNAAYVMPNVLVGILSLIREQNQKYKTDFYHKKVFFL